MSTNPEHFETQRRSFDELTAKMAQIALESLLSPAAHESLYSRAMLGCYDRASEILKTTPELGTFFMHAGAEIAPSEEESLRVNSLLRLRSYAEEGLLDAGVLSGVSREVFPEDYVYQASDVEAFKALFAHAAATAPAPAENSLPAECDESADEPIEEEINVLDVLEHIESKGLEGPALALVRRAMSGSPVRLSALRREEWEVITLSKQEFEQFAGELPAIKAQILALLNEVRIAARWKESGKGDKTDFSLLVGPAAETPAPADKTAFEKSTFGDAHLWRQRGSKRTSPAPQLPTDSSERDTSDCPDGETETEEAVIDLTLLEDITAALAQGDGRLSTVSRIVAEQRGLSRLETRNHILTLIDSKLLFKNGTEKGALVIGLAEVDRERRRSKHGTHGVEAVSSEGLSTEEIKTVRSLCDALIVARYQEKGVLVLDAARRLEVDDTDLKRLISRVEARGLLVRELRRVKSRGGSRSRANRTGTFVKFPTMDAWNRYREDPAAYLNILSEQI